MYSLVYSGLAAETERTTMKGTQFVPGPHECGSQSTQASRIQWGLWESFDSAISVGNQSG